MNKYTLSRVIVNRVHRKWRVILDFEGRGFTLIDFWDGERPQEIVARVRAWIDSFESQVASLASTDEKTNACKVCRFYEPFLHTGQCRRYPPHVKHGFPEVKEDCLCGEFAP